MNWVKFLRKKTKYKESIVNIQSKNYKTLQLERGKYS